jgi:hypothetical protein
MIAITIIIFGIILLNILLYFLFRKKICTYIIDEKYVPNKNDSVINLILSNTSTNEYVYDIGFSFASNIGDYAEMRLIKGGQKEISSMIYTNPDQIDIQLMIYSISNIKNNNSAVRIMKSGISPSYTIVNVGFGEAKFLCVKVIMKNTNTYEFIIGDCKLCP